MKGRREGEREGRKGGREGRRGGRGERERGTDDLRSNKKLS